MASNASRPAGRASRGRRLRRLAKDHPVVAAAMATATATVAAAMATATATVIGATITSMATAADAPAGVPQAAASSRPGSVEPGAALAGASPTAPAGSATPTTSVTPPSNGYHEYDLEMNPGFGYDLDIGPGDSPTQHAGYGHPGAQYRDVYLSSVKGHPAGPVLYAFGEDGRTVRLMRPTDPPDACRVLAPDEGGYLFLNRIRVNDRVCVRTRDDRWVMLHIKGLPGTTMQLLQVHVSATSTKG